MSNITDLEAAELSQNVYDPDHNHLYKGWQRVTVPNSPVPFRDDSTGFLSQLYRKETSPGQYEYVLAFAGTDPTSVSDIKTDFEQAGTGKAAQFEHARALSEYLSSHYGDNLSYTGHSLGGGLATYASMNTGKPATVFNPAAVSRKNSNYSYIPEGQVKNIIHEGDPVNFAQNLMNIQSQGDRVLIGQDTGNSKTNHDINSVIRALTPAPFLVSKIENEDPDKISPNNTPVLEILPCSSSSLENTRDIKEDEPEDSIEITCSHSRPQLKKVMPFFELVPDKNSLSDSLSVAWTGPNKPASLKLIEDNTHKSTEGFDFKPEYIEKTNIYIKSYTDLFVLLKDPTAYFLSGLPNGNLPVKVYSPVTWELKIKIPKVPILKAGAKLVGDTFADQNKKIETNYSNGNKLVEESRTKDNVTTTRETLNDERISNSVKTKNSGDTDFTESTTSKAYYISKERNIYTQDAQTSKDLKSDLPIQLRQDGALVTSDLISMVAGIVNLADNVYGIIKLIKDNAPQVGWYIDFDIQWFQGDFILEWGKKEFEDHRAYNWYKATIDISVINASIELGFGVSGFGFKVQVFGKLSGEIKAMLAFEVDSPESKKFPMEVSGEITGALGARVEVGFFLKVEASIESGISVKSGVVYLISTELKIDGELIVEWTGIKAKLEGGLGKGDGVGTKANSKEYELVPPSVLYKYKFFKKEEIKKENMNFSQISYKIYEKFTNTIFDLRIIEKKRISSALEKTYDLHHIADLVAKKVVSRDDLKRDEKAIESFAIGVNEDLRLLSKRWGLNGMTYNSLLNYLNGADFTARLIGIMDPTKFIIPSTNNTQNIA